MRTFSFLLILLCSISFFNDCVFAQKNVSYPIAFLPSSKTNIYGLAVGPIGSEVLCSAKYIKKSTGLNIQLFGQGFMLAFTAFNPPFQETYKNTESFVDFSNENLDLKSFHSGLIISPFGTMTSRIDGFSVSCCMSGGKIINGVSVNLLWNLYDESNGLSIGLFNSNLKTNGFQLGLINKTVKLKGFQIGLWNKNEKRSLPIINWNFTD